MKRVFKEIEYKEYTDTFSDTVCLWKLEDKEWVKERKRIWGEILQRKTLNSKDFNQKYWKERERFFLRAKPQLNDKKIRFDERFAMTPFTETNQIKALFDTEHIGLKQTTHERILRLANRYYQAVPEEFYRVELIVDALFRKENVCQTEVLGKKIKLVTTPPKTFTAMYINEAIFFIKQSTKEYREHLIKNSNWHFNGLERNYVEITFEYFIESINKVVESDIDSPYVQLCKDFKENFRELIKIIDDYKPDISNTYRDKYIDNLKKHVVSNDKIHSLI